MTEGPAVERPAARTAAPTRLALRLLRRLGADPEAPVGQEGRWPSTKQAFLWDLLPADLAPDKDGVVPPTWSPPEWVAGIEPRRLPDAIELERAAHRAQHDRVAIVEAKASRLLTPTVTLLAATAAVTAFELKSASTARTLAGAALPAAGATAGVIASLFLLGCVLRALDADIRVGVFGGATTNEVLAGSHEALEQEALATTRAGWVSANKTTRLMHARAGLSRALVAIAVALAFGAVTLVTRESTPAPTRDGTKSRTSAPAATPTAVPPTPSAPPSPSATATPPAPTPAAAPPTVPAPANPSRPPKPSAAPSP